MRRKPSASLVVAVTALVGTLGGTAVAAKFGPFKGDKIIRKHSLSGNRLKDHTITGNEVNLSQLGKVPNATNADVARFAVKASTATRADHASNSDQLGGTPASGYQGKTRWALISDSGAVLAQSGGVSVEQHLTAAYWLDFGSPVTSRPIMVTIHWPEEGTAAAAPCGGTGTPGGVNCSFINDGNHLYIQTRNSTGTSTDLEFYVSVESP
jgi:hypothetical protein